MSISSIYILDKKGNILIHRNYRGDPDPEAIEKFQKRLISQGDKAVLPYIIDEESAAAYTYLQHRNLICELTSPRHFPPECQRSDDPRVLQGTD
jgi:AP-1 complex subunit mu